MPRLPPKLLYRLFPLAGRASFWVERRLTPAGRMVFALGVGALLFGVDMRQTLAYQVAALALAALVAARLAGVGWRPRLTISRVLPDFATRGTSLVYFVEIANHGQRVERDLVLGDSLLTPALDYAAFNAAARATAGAAATSSTAPSVFRAGSPCAVTTAAPISGWSRYRRSRRGRASAYPSN